MFWTKEDSNNLASIACSLEKLSEREFERSLLDKTPFNRVIKRGIEKIKVTESPSTEDEALEEAIQRGQKMQAKVTEAHRTGNVPYIVEDLFDEEELESL